METVWFGSSLVYAPSHSSKPLSLRFRACATDVPDFLSADCTEEAATYQLNALMFNDQPLADYCIEVMYRFSAEEAATYQLDALMFNDQPLADYCIEVICRFTGFDPFEDQHISAPSLI